MKPITRIQPGVKPTTPSLQRIITLTASVLMLATTSALAERHGSSPGVPPPHSTPYGRSGGKWSAAWWQWCFSLPTTAHPLFDTADISAGRSGRVWFPGGTFTPTTLPDETVLGRVNRTVRIPTGRALLIPLINNEADDVGVEPPLTEGDLWALVSGNQDHTTGLYCSVDGVPVAGLQDPVNTAFRVKSPGSFSMTLLEEDNLYQFVGYDPKGTVAPAVADGVFLMLAPLSRGHHTVRSGGRLQFTTARMASISPSFRTSPATSRWGNSRRPGPNLSKVIAI